MNFPMNLTRAIGTRKVIMKKNKLDAKEKAILSSFNKGEWKSVKNLIEEKALARKIAANTPHKNIQK